MQWYENDLAKRLQAVESALSGVGQLLHGGLPARSVAPLLTTITALLVEIDTEVTNTTAREDR